MKKTLDFCRLFWYSNKRASGKNFSRVKNNLKKSKKTLDKNLKMRYNKRVASEKATQKNLDN